MGEIKVSKILYLRFKNKINKLGRVKVGRIKKNQKLENK